MLAEILNSMHSMSLPLESASAIRLQACSAVVQTLSLVLNYDQYSSDDLFYGSRLLLDPIPELMVEVVSESGKAIYSLINSCEILPSSARVMLAVLSSALAVLSQISRTASIVLLSFHQYERTHQLKMLSASPIPNDPAPRTVDGKFPVWDENITHHFLREMETRNDFDSSSLEGIIREHDQTELRDFDASSYMYPTASEESVFSFHLTPESSNSCELPSDYAGQG